MSQENPHSPPCAIQPEFGNDYLKWMTSLESRAQEVGASLQREVEPEYQRVAINDRKLVEASDSFCELAGHQREEPIGMLYDDLSTPDNPADQTAYDLNVLGAFAVAKYWEDVRTKIQALAGSDGTVPLLEALRIIDEPVTEIVRMFNNALKAAQGV